MLTEITDKLKKTYIFIIFQLYVWSSDEVSWRFCINLKLKLSRKALFLYFFYEQHIYVAGNVL